MFDPDQSSGREAAPELKARFAAAVLASFKTDVLVRH
jgi:hypothetical protein